MHRFQSIFFPSITWLAATVLSAQEFDTNAAWNYEVYASYAGETDLLQGKTPAGDISSSYVSVHVSQMASPRDDGLQLGAFTSWWHFRPDFGTFVPEDLYELGLQISYTSDFNQDWSWRASIAPGLYSDFRDIDFKDLNAPANFSVSYRWTPELTLTGAIIIDFRAKYPVLGGIGLRWMISEDWTLNLIFPRPGLEYRVTENLTLFGGLSLAGGSYNIADNFGTLRGDKRLDDEFIDYREIRAGFSAAWRWDDSAKFVLGAGALLDRRFQFDIIGRQLISDDTYYLEASWQNAF